MEEVRKKKCYSESTILGMFALHNVLTFLWVDAPFHILNATVQLKESPRAAVGSHEFYDAETTAVVLCGQKKTILKIEIPMSQACEAGNTRWHIETGEVFVTTVDPSLYLVLAITKEKRIPLASQVVVDFSRLERSTAEAVREMDRRLAALRSKSA